MLTAKEMKDECGDDDEDEGRQPANLITPMDSPLVPLSRCHYLAHGIS